jgi:hypothetical protein
MILINMNVTLLMKIIKHIVLINLDSKSDFFLNKL